MVSKHKLTDRSAILLLLLVVVVVVIFVIVTRKLAFI